LQTEIEEEEVIETTNAEASRRALTEVLGPERRDRILSALYMVRHDGVNVVRQSSIHIWKALVQNTPRTGQLTFLSRNLSISDTTSLFQCENCFRSLSIRSSL
jgi:hypothetical protein